MTIDEMIAKPGFYRVSTTSALLRGLYTRVEVDPGGTVHQLTPEGKRDGILTRAGWTGDLVISRERTSLGGAVNG